MQIATKSMRRWSAPEVSPAVAAAFADRWKRSRVASVVAHASYLINVASRDGTYVFPMSVRALADELRRADALGIPTVVLHAGSHGGAGLREGMKRLVEGLCVALGEARGLRAGVALENMAGEGTTIGFRLEQLAQVLGEVGDPRLGCCIDICHLFAAGYDLRTERGYEGVMREVEATVGLERVRVVHLSDSAGALGSRVDRHAERPSRLVTSTRVARV